MILHRRLTPANPVLSSSNALSGFSHLPWLVILLFMSALQPLYAATSAVGATPGSFRVSESGAAVYSIPLTLPPGTAGMAPKLSLTYNSQSGNGILGMGWSLEGLSGIYRCPASIAQDGFKGGINFDGNDRFCLDGQRLVAVSGNYGADGTEYRTETESYSRIISYGTAGSGPAWFKVWTKAGQIAEYGNSDDSRIEAQGRADVRMWGVNKVSDTKGNYWTATYSEDNANGEAYVSRIDYTGNAAMGIAPYASVQFGYETRLDTTTAYLAGSLIKLQKKLKFIKTFNETSLIKNYELNFINNGTWHLDSNNSADGSLLTKIQECDGNSTCFKPINLIWNLGTIDPGMFSTQQTWGNYEILATGDVNSDGMSDTVSVDKYGNLYLEIASGNGVNLSTPIGESLVGYCVQMSKGGCGRTLWPKVMLADMNGDGKADLFKGKSVQLSLGDSFGESQSFSNYEIISAGDVNGDNLADVISVDSNKYSEGLQNLYLELSSVTGVYSTIPINEGLAGYCLEYTKGGCKSIGRPNVFLADMNGDGKADLFKGKSVQLSHGDSFGESKSFSNYEIISAGDVNGDNMADVISVDSNGEGGGWLYMELSSGNGVYSTKPIGEYLFSHCEIASKQTCVFTVRPSVLLTDVTGDGLVDMLFNNLLFQSKTPSFDFIKNVEFDWGKYIKIDLEKLSSDYLYKPDTDEYSYPTRKLLPFLHLYLVSSISRADGIGGDYKTDYTYAGAKLHLTGGGFLGFRQVTATDAQTGIVTTSTYGQDYPNQGLPLSVEKKTASGQLLNQVQNTWQNKSLGAGAYHRSDLVESVEQSWELNGSAMPRTKTSSVFDDYGNATQITVATDDGYTSVPISPYGNVKLTQNTYSNDTANWLLGRLSRATLTSTLPSGVSATRTSSFGYEASSGLLVQEVIEPDNADFKLVTDYTLDGFGNRVASTVSGIDIPTSNTTATFDSQGRFPLSSTNAKGHTETRTFDPAFGNPLSVTGPNGLTTTYVYDGFGRKIQENRPDKTQSTSSLSWCAADCPANAVYSETSTSSGSPSVTVYFDSLNRPIRRETVGFDGRISSQDSQYDSLGRVSAKSRPYFVGDSVAWTQYQYDVLGRVIATTEPDTGVTLTDYNGLVTTVTNANGQAAQQEKNGVGQLVKTTDAYQASMLYAYDPFGNLTETTDPHGNMTRIEYDLRGRKTALHDPDMGDWAYGYNVLGELVWQKNAKGQVTRLFYDTLGRMTQRREVDLISTWKWDTAKMGKGKLASFSSNNGHSRSYSYDALGRVKTVRTVMDGKTFSFTSQYDGFSRLLKTLYPTGFAVQNLYNGNGYLAEVRDAATKKPFWQALKVDAAGRVTEESLGNGLVTQRDYDEVGHTIGIRTNPFSGEAIQDLSLHYDLVGNLMSRTDAVLSRTDMFGYDDLNRLTSYPDQSGNPVNLSYNEIGNITYKSDVGSYSYGALPHAVSKIRGKLNSNFVYDADGNQTAGLKRTLTYTTWDMPASITLGNNTLSYQYDAEHQRFRQDSPAGKTFYISPRVDQGIHFEQSVSNFGEIESRHHVYAGNQVIGEFLIANSGARSMRYFHSDHLGSVDAVTDDKGKVVARYDFQPFGKRSLIEGKGNTTRHGFTGHEHLTEVGLVHMNGRVYDPVTGRFLSADPTIQFPDNLQSYNRYSYVMNNPLAFTDPSGYGIGKFFKKLWNNDIVRNVVSFAAAFITQQYWAPFGAFSFANSVAGGFVGGLVQTGNLNGAVHGAFSSGLFYGAGQINLGINSLEGKAISKAITGCLSASLSSGNCGREALMAGVKEYGGTYLGGSASSSKMFAAFDAGSEAQSSFADRFLANWERSQKVADEFWDLYETTKTIEKFKEAVLFGKVIGQSYYLDGLFAGRIAGTFIGSLTMDLFVVPAYVIGGGVAMGSAIHAAISPFNDNILNWSIVRQGFSLYGLDYSTSPTPAKGYVDVGQAIPVPLSGQ